MKQHWFKISFHILRFTPPPPPPNPPIQKWKKSMEDRGGGFWWGEGGGGVTVSVWFYGCMFLDKVILLDSETPLYFFFFVLVKMNRCCLPLRHFSTLFFHLHIPPSACWPVLWVQFLSCILSLYSHHRCFWCSSYHAFSLYTLITSALGAVPVMHFLCILSSGWTSFDFITWVQLVRLEAWNCLLLFLSLFLCCLKVPVSQKKTKQRRKQNNNNRQSAWKWRLYSSGFVKIEYHPHSPSVFNIRTLIYHRLKSILLAQGLKGGAVSR